MPPLLSPFLQKTRFSIVSPYLQGDVLDLGCNTAEITRLLNPSQFYTGIDSRRDVIERLRETKKRYQFYIHNLDEDTLELDRKFDTVLMVAVIEHLKKPDNIVRQIPGLLNPGGHFVITTPSHHGDQIHQVGARLGLFSPEAMKNHEHIYTPQEMKKFLSNYGLTVIHFHRFLLGGNQLFVSRLGGG
jgi:2-polyprenyl-3-methyl-5-hydroxy-6-metoxy-1,4-benzoquinol methylase